MRGATAVRSAITLAAAAAIGTAAPAGAQQTRPGANPSVDPTNAWRTMARRDLDFAIATVRAQNVSAVYPDPAGFATRLAALGRIADAEIARVDSFGGYWAVLKHFFNGLDDEHDAVNFAIGQTRLFWPGFVATYQGQRYRVAASITPAVPNGAEITACDGRPMDEWTTRVAAYDGGHPGLESTKASAALAMMIDRANPFLTRPTSCTIDGKTVALDWSRIRYPDYARTVLPLAGVEDRTAAITPFGADGAWVRLGYFEPNDGAEAAAFRAVVAGAPALRDKAVIVLDVRQNGGGPYNWFMDFLRGLYGEAYADYYARARLQISPVYRATPEILAYYRSFDANDAALNTPKDGPRGDPSTRGVADAVAAGRPVFKLPRPAPLPLGKAPANPVRARVLVLTDYGCASACIGFVDELKRFPGVEQIGVETFVDNRTGTPLFAPLPSGNGSVMVATMTRDGRERGDNVPQKPAHTFAGDIADTAAVKDWIMRSVIGARPAR